MANTKISKSGHGPCYDCVVHYSTDDDNVSSIESWASRSSSATDSSSASSVSELSYRKYRDSEAGE